MTKDSYLDRWGAWYRNDSTLAEYGDKVTYKIGADFLKGLAVEDWGCGRGWFKTVHDGPYVGIDGTASEHADIVADLRVYRSETPGLWIRGVIEHNRDWKLVLDNAVASAQERIAIVVFTPDGDGEQIGYTEELDVPDIAVPHKVIADAVTAAGFELEQYTMPTGSYYKEETLFLGIRKQ
jgi:hypothetical protein